MVPRPLSRQAERIRVARVITRLNVGGPAIQAMLLARRLDPTRYETLLVCGRTGPHEGDMLELRREPGVTPFFLSELGRGIKWSDDLLAFIRLVRAFRAFRPEVVHTHLAKAGFLGRLAARAVGVPVVIHTYHGNVLRGYFGPARTRLFLLIERALARVTTRVVALSARQETELRQLRIAGPGRVVRIPLGLDLAPFLDPPRGILRGELGLDPRTPLVGIVARLVPIKGLDVFLDAAVRVHADLANARFVVVGDGEERSALAERTRRLGIADRVRFLGWRADLAAIYGDLDVLALTSRNEGTPVSIIEAMAAGRPVVATAVGGVPDLVADGVSGLLAPAGDADAVARAILRLLGDPATGERMGLVGRSIAYPEYDATTLLARIDALYRSVTARPP